MFEEAYVVFPSGSIKRVSTEQDHDQVSDDLKKLIKLWKTFGKKPFEHIHTHPYESEEDFPGLMGLIPSFNDMISFLFEDECNRMTILRTEKGKALPTDFLRMTKTGQFVPSGYSYINPDKKIPDMQELNQTAIYGRLISYRNSYRQFLQRNDVGLAERVLDGFARRNNLELLFGPHKQ